MLALGVACAPASAFSQGVHPDSLFQHLVGRWVLRGTIARQHTVHDVTFEWLLGREYVQMHEVSRERSPSGTPAYEAVVLFGRWQWHMDNDSARVRTPFARVTLTRR
jgi:hypothetical protein